MSSEGTRKAIILVVEDEDVVRRILAAILEDLGHTVLEARDGEEALAFMDKEAVDLLISDKNLPGISGIDVMRACREKRPQAEIIMVTGYASYETAVEALRLNACDYIEKPVLDLIGIRNRVQQAVDRRLLREVPTQPVPLAELLVAAIKASSKDSDKATLATAEQLLSSLKG